MGHIPDEELVSVYRVQRDHWKAIWKARAEKAERERDDARLSCDQWKKEWELSERNKMDREAELAVIREEKNVAYSERNRLVAALSALYPSHLQRHPEGDVEWEDDWRWIVVVQLATGQATWHIHDSELNWFDHLDRNQVTEWDGHTTDEKYLRLDTIRMARNCNQDYCD